MNLTILISPSLCTFRNARIFIFSKVRSVRWRNGMRSTSFPTLAHCVKHSQDISTSQPHLHLRYSTTFQHWYDDFLHIYRKFKNFENNYNVQFLGIWWSREERTRNSWKGTPDFFQWSIIILKIIIIKNRLTGGWSLLHGAFMRTCSLRAWSFYYSYLL